jgi:hypothetical protein
MLALVGPKEEGLVSEDRKPDHAPSLIPLVFVLAKGWIGLDNLGRAGEHAWPDAHWDSTRVNRYAVLVALDRSRLQPVAGRLV